MKTALLALALISLAPIAQAQIVIQAPPIPGVRPAYPEGYWRGEEREGWRRREEYREEEHRREEWQRAHCVRDWQGREFCRR